MKRLLLLVLIAVIAALAIIFATRQRTAASNTTITSLLPADTALFVHLPDAEKNREDWHRTDLYQLYREPAVQEFLQKPKGQLPKQSTIVDAWRDSGSLRIRDAFVATSSFDSLRLTGGFEFRCHDKQATSVIEQWKSQLLAKSPGAQRSSTNYEKHVIDVITAPSATFASIIVGKQFFAATNLDDLKALLDRVDHRSGGSGLGGDPNFAAAMKQMPRDYAWMFFLQPKQLIQKLATLRGQVGRGTDQQSLIERVQSFSHAMVFEGAKIRDISFAAMPRLVEAKLARRTLSIASSDTLLYVATILNLQQQIDGMLKPGGSGPQALPFDAMANALRSAGISSADWKTAFGEELSILTDWPAKARIPSAIATLDVRDGATARKIADAIAASEGWQPATRNNVEYYSPTSGLSPAFTPLIALSDRLMVIGIDSTTIDHAVSAGQKASPLAATVSFRDATKLVPDPQQMFVYIDLATLYLRLDAALRPLLQMSAAFVPGSSEYFDANKLPAAEVVTKHLSPVVASQSYLDGGYKSESVGPVTIGQSLGLAAAAYLGSTMVRRHADADVLAPSGVTAPSSPIPSAPANSPSPTP